MLQKLLLILNLCAGVAFSGYTQEEDLPSSTVHFAFGAIPIDPPVLAFGAYADWFVFRKQTPDYVWPFLRAGGGLRGSTSFSDVYVVVQGGALINLNLWLENTNRHHFELAAGYFAQPRPWQLPPVSAVVGYRYQRPNGLRLIRAGVSYPEGLYLGVGFLIGG